MKKKRLPVDEFESFLKENQKVLVCFVNDGSKDKTEDLLSRLKEDYPNNVDVVSLLTNQGKAEAVRQGFTHCNQKYEHQYIAYLDADLATTLEECNALTSYLNATVNFVFGSRMMKLGSKIERSKFRFIVGRIIATFISNILKLKVYDTQCGCKLFSKEISVGLFQHPFISKWLFDVEIFKRFLLIYGKEKAMIKMLEIPLKKWIDKGKSKVSASYFFRMWWDLYSINKFYKSNSDAYSVKPNTIIDENA